MVELSLAPALPGAYAVDTSGQLQLGSGWKRYGFIHPCGCYKTLHNDFRG